MPLYAYQCPKCASVLEFMRKYEHRDQLPLCFKSDCDGMVEMSRLLSAPALSFKGSGWTPRHYHTGEGD